MKKLLNILSVVTLTGVGTSGVTACKDNVIDKKDKNNEENKNEEEKAVKNFNGISLA
ncbi:MULTISPECIES: lipoprotein [unclassified Spiroplasma]|uniref:lipoprotein n=1 Tax=unclassified Spiroplasma TaxID=2637901 RepID=UPI0030D21228